jgi:glycine/D-amino acid oxidase-like deaminating enzyme
MNLNPHQQDVLDVVVVGAGLAGLTAAQLARRAGATVTLLDGNPPGGRARSFVRNGFIFNTGPRALYKGGAGQAVLDRLGVLRPGGKPPISHTKFLTHDKLVVAPVSARGFMFTPTLSGKSKAAVGKVFGSLPRAKPDSFAALSVLDWFSDLGLAPDAQAVLGSVIRLGTYCADLHMLSADAAIVALQASARGVLYLNGGWQALVDQLTPGLDIRRDRAVSVHSDNTHAEVTTQTGQVLRTRTVIIAASSPQAAQGLLQSTLKPHGPAVEASCLNVGSARKPDPVIVLGLDEPVYMSTHGIVANLVTDNRPGIVVHAMRYRSIDGPNPDHHATRDQLTQLVATAGIDTHDIFESEYLHAMTVCSAIPTPALGGMAGRISVDGTGHQNVFLAGDYVGSSGTLVDASFSSAALAADNVIARFTHLR